MTGGHLRNIFSSNRVLRKKGEGTHNHERKVHSIIRMSDEIYIFHLHTCMPYERLIVFSCVLEHLVRLLPPLVVLPCVLEHLVRLSQPIVVLPHVLEHLVRLSQPIVVLPRVLEHLVPLSQRMRNGGMAEWWNGGMAEWWNSGWKGKLRNGGQTYHIMVLTTSQIDNIIIIIPAIKIKPKKGIMSIFATKNNVGN